MKTSTHLLNADSSAKASLRALYPVLLSAMLLSAAPSYSAESVDQKLNVKVQINRVYVRDGRLVKISGAAASPVVRSGAALRSGATIDEPEFLWNRSTLSWVKNPRYGMAKIVAGSSTESDNAVRKRE